MELLPRMPSDDFTRLVDAHYTPLYRFALNLAKNSADAGDLTQQTFFLWATRGQGVREVDKIKSWLFTTLYREFLRSRRRADRVEALDDLGPVEADPPAPEETTFAASGVAIEAMQEIDEIYRVPLTLFYLQEFSYKEIAQMLEVPIGTVMSRIARGKTHLRAALARKKQGDRSRLASPYSA